MQSLRLQVFAAFVGLVGLIEAVPGTLPPTVIGTLSGGQKVRAFHQGGLLKRAGRAVAASDKEAAVLRHDSNISPDGFQYAYETNNGISAQASGSLKKGAEGEAIAVQGQYQYSAPDGTPIQVQYVADESGYHPTGAHLPGSQPTPNTAHTAVLAHPHPNVYKP